MKKRNRYRWLVLLALLPCIPMRAQSLQQMIKLIEQDRDNISPAGRSANDGFGLSVAVSGDYAIVGAFQEDEDTAGTNYANAAGSAFIFVRVDTTWVLEQKLTASDRDANDNFGTSVSISGDYAIVGSPYDDHNASGGATASNAGSAYIFVRNGNHWTQQQKIVASDRAIADYFGSSVAISGNYVVVGAPSEDQDQNGANTATDAGSAYVFVRSGTIWSEQQKIDASDRATGDQFGNSVAIDGDYLVVSAYLEDEDVTGSNTLSEAGSAYIFARSGTTWSQQAKLVASDRTSGDNFGNSVAISGDYVIVGAPFQDSSATGLTALLNAGAAYIFNRSGNVWTQQQKIVSSDRALSDEFGFSVGISGDYAVMGAPFDDGESGSAYVFFRSGSTWSEEQKILSTDRSGGDRSGYAVSISGNHTLLGAPREDEDAFGGTSMGSAGSAYAFDRSGTSWSQQEKITVLDKAGGDQFGYSVAVSGDYAIVGAPYDDEDSSGGNSALSAGSAYIFYRSGGVWTFSKSCPRSTVRQTTDSEFPCPSPVIMPLSAHNLKTKMQQVPPLHPMQEVRTSMFAAAPHGISSKRLWRETDLQATTLEIL